MKARLDGSDMAQSRIISPIECVWDYPQPPRLARCQHSIRVFFGGQMIAESENVVRVLETSHPPTYYIPSADVRFEFLAPSSHRSWCEWKGQAHYWTLRVEDHESCNAAWSYPDPTRRFVAIRDHLAFYPTRVDACYVGAERVSPQEGDFYGGWITSNIRGPFKGGPGTLGW
jgi:uncharacterized protein (DUF427 family)